MALMLRYVEDNEEVARQYARVMIRSFMFDLDTRDVYHLMNNIITETTNDIRKFEGGAASRSDVSCDG